MSKLKLNYQVTYKGWDRGEFTKPIQMEVTLPTVEGNLRSCIVRAIRSQSQYKRFILLDYTKLDRKEDHVS